MVAPPKHLETLGRRYSPGLPLTLDAILARQNSRASERLESDASRLDTMFEAEQEGGPMGHTTVLLQGFNWECSKRSIPSWYSLLTSRAAVIAAAGITAVWLPPPSASVSIEGYMPGELEDLNSRYGTEAELRQLLRALRRVGVKSVADCVLNHRCAGKQDAEGRWNVYTGRYPWDAGCICSGDDKFGGTGAPKEGPPFDAAPNLDHRNPRVCKDIKAWLTWLRRDIGFDGLRFDFVKGFKGCHVGGYVEASHPSLAVGEFWDDCVYENGSQLAYNQDSHRQRIVDWCDATLGHSAAFDFTTKGILQEAVAKREYWRLRDSTGKPPGVLGWWPSRAVSFVENHDTGSTQQHWPFPATELHQGYCYILTHPGTPCIFYDHMWTDGQLRPSLWRRLRSAVAEATGQAGSTVLMPLRSSIVQLIALRRRTGVSPDSEVQIIEANDSVYAAVIGCRLAMKIGFGAWTPQGAGIDMGQKAWLLAASGRNFAAWEALMQ